MSEDKQLVALQEIHDQWFSNGQLDGGRGIPCPLCDSVVLSPYWEKDNFRFSQCSKCAFVFLNPQPPLEKLHNFYASPFMMMYNEAKFNNQSKVEQEVIAGDTRWILDQVAMRIDLSSACVLEIGPGGRGDLLSAAIARGCDVVAIELDQNLASMLNIRFGNQVTVINQTIEESSLESEKFELVVMRDVLEHLANPLLILEQVRRLLKPDGHLAVIVPNIDGWIYRLVGRRHTTVFGFEHVNYWSAETLKMALRKSGFRLESERHESIDMSLRTIFSYWFGPSTFTTVFPRRRSVVTRVFHWVGNKLLRPLSRYDVFWLRRLSEKSRKGSVIQILCQKI